MSHRPAHHTTVLVVDDEALVLMYAVDMLEDAGFAVVEATGAEEALQRLEEHPEISVLFTDINMPGRFDGLELARRVHVRRPDVQLIITSGRAQPPKTEMVGEGCFVAKPYRGETVAKLIRATQGR